MPTGEWSEHNSNSSFLLQLGLITFPTYTPKNKACCQCALPRATQRPLPHHILPRDHIPFIQQKDHHPHLTVSLSSDLTQNPGHGLHADWELKAEGLQNCHLPCLKTRIPEVAEKQQSQPYVS